MSSWWKGTSRDRFEEAERRMLAHSGIAVEEFDI